MVGGGRGGKRGRAAEAALPPVVLDAELRVRGILGGGPQPPPGPTDGGGSPVDGERREPAAGAGAVLVHLGRLVGSGKPRQKPERSGLLSFVGQKKI